MLIGLTPTMPLHTLMVVAFTIITRTSTIAGIIASILVCNPLTYFPIYYFSASLGNLVTPYEINRDWLESFFSQLINSETFVDSIRVLGDLGYETIIVMITGGILFALPFAIFSFYLSLYFFRKYSASSRKKHRLL